MTSSTIGIPENVVVATFTNEVVVDGVVVLTPGGGEESFAEHAATRNKTPTARPAY
jgi:hypothetical protein